MAARALQLTPLPRPPSTLQTLSRIAVSSTPSKIQSSHGAVLRKTKKIEEQDLYGLPKEYYDDEWQAQQWEKTKELHQRRQEEDEEEERKIDEYREVGMRLKDYPEEEVQKARQLVSGFIKSAEEVEEKIEEAAERGELTELVLMVIRNRLDLARRDFRHVMKIVVVKSMLVLLSSYQSMRMGLACICALGDFLFIFITLTSEFVIMNEVLGPSCCHDDVNYILWMTIIMIMIIMIGA
ncbi:hypothetical protein TEA_020724 [Camellia sinensis var. sinensis]|uniref:Uncharacterized protein n=1 Tax=Camellia sinensis var. sinensis TaxID=542762 RepID=A0A4S4EGC1_CAMSN|nr:hypothetical protein TEA_020724 [Camellia sinensis var. sinensis]